MKGGELKDLMVKRSKMGKIFQEGEVQIIAWQLKFVLNYIHGQNIVHRDIKPENIMLHVEGDEKLTIKLGDFGFSSYFAHDKKLDLYLGSPSYMAPEIIKGLGYDEKVDIWSAGVVIY